MSGIAGIYYLDGRPVEHGDLQRMLDSIAHRGPDGSGVWVDGAVGLGHRMLRTTPESLHEKLPLGDKTGELAITADARIDNRDELLSALNFNGRRHEAIADSEIILAAYAKWDERCPERLLGDFAFAIWDGRKKKLFCARDPLGIKPFFYYFDGKTFYWGSEPRVIYEDSKISKEPNLTLICLYLLNRFDEREETLYKDIYRLLPSHFMVLENGHLKKGQYWDIDPNYAIRYKTDQEYAECFLELFKKAIRARLRSNGPVGALLSGGLDSSSIVCTAQMLYREGVIPNNTFETFSIVYDKLPCDERSYIHEVALKWNFHANDFIYERNLSSVDFEQTGRFSDVGYFPTLICHAPAFRYAQQKGIKSMLNGVGGDDLLAVDFAHLTDLMLEWNPPKLFKQLRHDSALYSRSPYSIFIDYCIKPLIPRPIKTSIKQILKPFRGNGIPPWLNVACLKKAGVEERLRAAARPKTFPTFSQQHIYNVLLYGWNRNIASDMVERFGGHFGMESRYPFFDKSLVQFLIAVPEEQRWRGEWPKAILRLAMDGILPELVRMRKDKAKLIYSIDQELKGRQSRKVENLIQTSVLSTLEIIHSGQFHKLFNDYQKGIATHRIINTLEAFVWIELWCRSVWGIPKGGDNDGKIQESQRQRIG
jgi:asparagine synthase (glutamine-hydrolysing)